ncbi:histidinol dehydrogenase [Marinihelvus fidelis]|uniref:Histidinol dehydrogenase n=2 Tax=Marinihelvus fidelis TaxID=2613842 RepID=A0A5N0T9Q9_9GAMM|nr:histidinol dehydrogenase [Marinihelvus fidelis]
MVIPDIQDWAGLDADARADALARPALDQSGLADQVASILAGVREGGDQALLDYTERFDGVRPAALRVPAETLANAADAVSPSLLVAIDRAMARITAFHDAGRPRALAMDTEDGLRCEARYAPIEPVGLYVPGGSAPLISTVMMLGIPARLAGCSQVVLCTPPGPDGEIDAAILATAHRCGIDTVIRAGGSQAIAAMAFGTASVPACAKLFGPGNAWVTEAKRQAAATPGGAAQDMPAGPSEVLVIADDGADPVAVAWDLLSQAEHGPDSQALLFSDSRDLLVAVRKVLPELASQLPRADVLARSLAHARFLLVADLDQAITLSNRYAPEHLIINTRDANERVDGVTAAGSVFLGPWTPESLGDYCSGTNHVLPTYGHARAFSGLSVRDFMRRMTVQRATPQGLGTAGPDAVTLAAAEGLDAHRMAVAYRLASLP